MRFTFDSRFPDGTPRRFAGTWRPERSQAQTYYDNTPWEDRINTMQGNSHASWAHMNWERGAFDRALYHVEDDER